MENRQESKVVMLIVVASMMPVCCLSAVDHTVGGASGWDLSSDISGWAAKTAFHPGDFLVFNYTPLHDVLEVNRTEFAACKTINPIGAYSDGETVLPLSKVGITRYFFCGREDHCSRGLKLRVRVTNPRGGRGRGSHQPNPNEDPTQDKGPKAGPSPKSGAWDGKPNGWFGYHWTVGFLAVATMIFHLHLITSCNPSPLHLIVP